MRNFQFIIFLMCLLPTSLGLQAADRLKVVSFEISKEKTAEIHQRLDINDELCALIRIVSTDPINKVEGNFIPDEQGNSVMQKDDETWVYLTEGSRQVRLFSEHHLPMTVDFSDFNVRSLKGGITYVLNLSEANTGDSQTVKSNGQASDSSDDEGNFLIVSIKPSDAEVTVDGKKLEREEESGLMSVFLERGVHQFEAKAPNCFDTKKSINIESEPVRLDIDMTASAQFFLKYSPADATVIINGEEQPTDQNGLYVEQMSLGTYTYRLEAKGCSPVERTVTLHQGQNRYAEVLPLPAISDKGAKEGDRKVYTVNGVPFTMVFVNGGTFNMTDIVYGERRLKDVIITELPFGGVTMDSIFTHDKIKEEIEVTLTPYWIAETETTEQLYNAVMGMEPTSSKKPKELEWKDAYAFMNRLRELTGVVFRIPTEAQWEYAARGGKKSKGYIYAGSNDIDEVAWYKDNRLKYDPVDVKQKKPNELNLYDMSGNQIEWTYDSYYKKKSKIATNPLYLQPTQLWDDSRTCRGGSYNTDEDDCEVTAQGVWRFTSEIMGGKPVLRMAIY